MLPANDCDRQGRKSPSEYPQQQFQQKIQAITSTSRLLSRSISRVNSAVIYKKTIYVWGAQNSEQKSTDLLAYGIKSGTWSVVQTTIVGGQLKKLTGYADVLRSNHWFFFGGVDQTNTYNSQLWKLDLDRYEWNKCRQGGSKPHQQEGSILISIKNKWLLLYEGFNSNQAFSQQFYLYNIQSGFWFNCEGNYQYSLKNVVGSSICIQSGRIFMFGGAFNAGDQMLDLNEFYQLQLHLPNKQDASKLNLRPIHSLRKPSSRIQSFLLPFLENYLILVGGRSKELIANEFWIFSLVTESWSKPSLEVGLLDISWHKCIKLSQTLFIFGGKKDSSQIQNNSLWSIELHCQKLKQDKKIGQFEQSKCSICFEKSNNFNFSSHKFSSGLMLNISELIQFPFAAFGLLLDNCLIFGASTITITLQYDRKNTIIKIEDNGIFNLNQQYFLSSFYYFESQCNIILTSCNKKTKKDIHKINSARQFGVNLKLACMRLGKKSLYISLTEDTIRVCYCSYDNDNCMIYYYSMNSITQELTNQSMKDSQQYIDSQYKNMIRDVLNAKTSRNTLYIFETILDQEEQNCRFVVEKGDIVFGSRQDIEKLQKLGYCISQSIDISFKSYLSMLYLKNQTLSIQFGNKQNLSTIAMQGTLDMIDKMCKANLIVELDRLVDFDFKLIELYYLRDLVKHQLFFSNGFLFYYKNRLITRYKPKLGDMISYILEHGPQSYNCLPFFGYAELPENIPVNAFKTVKPFVFQDFSFSIMLQKLYSRIKFVEQSFKIRSKKFAIVEKSNKFMMKPKKQTESSKKRQPNNSKRERRETRLNCHSIEDESFDVEAHKRQKASKRRKLSPEDSS